MLGYDATAGVPAQLSAIFAAPPLSPLLEVLVDQVEDTLLLHRALIGEPAPEQSLTCMLAQVSQAIGAGIGAGLAARRTVEAHLRERSGMLGMEVEDDCEF